MIRTTRIVVLDENQRLLLLKRHSAKQRWPGLWDLPGGKLEYGEDAEQAAIRELDEETSLTVNQLEPLLDADVPRPDLERTYFLFHATVEGDPMITICGEHVDYRWVDPQALEELPTCDPADLAIEAWMSVHLMS